jgi:hypothetical protein
MGYQQVVFKASCGKCGSSVCLWKWNEWVYRIRHLNPWNCNKCGALNTPGKYEPWPEIPRKLYIGHDKNNQLKLYPVPPEAPHESWAQPYSIRSFVSQASRHFVGCSYSSWWRTEVMDEPVFTDRCTFPEIPESNGWDCHMVWGWTKGEQTCPLWENVSQLCQTDSERWFLHQYLGFVKDRPFPMLIPQPWMGIGERRRPDFALFVPLSYWKYRWYAVQLDKGHPPDKARADEIRDAEITEHGYKVIRVRPETSGYFGEVRSLVEKVEIEMKQAESDPMTVAKEVPVTVTEREEEDVPF